MGTDLEPDKQDMKDQICRAIGSKNLLEFYYKNNLRIVEPFTLGTSHKGNLVLRAYQIGGQSNSRKIPDWAPFEVVEISDLRILEEQFSGNRDGYRRGDSMMSVIYCQV